MTSFTGFGILPPEMRQLIWRYSLLSVGPPVVAVNVSTTEVSFKPLDSSVASIALSCKDAWREWMLIRNPATKSSYAQDQWLYILSNFGLLTAQVVKQADVIKTFQHMAVSMSKGANLVHIFKNLPRFKSLQTILIIFSKDSTRNEKVSKSSADMLSSIMNGRSPDGGAWDMDFKYVLRLNETVEKSVQDFYQRQDAPQVKLLVERGDQTGIGASGSVYAGFELFLDAPDHARWMYERVLAAPSLRSTSLQ